MAVEEVGRGVGYLESSSRASRVRLRGLGSTGDEDCNSNAGSSELRGRTKDMPGEAKPFGRGGEDPILKPFAGARSSRQKSNQCSGLRDRVLDAIEQKRATCVRQEQGTPYNST